MPNSFAAQSVAQGPMTLAPPSFNGHGWLVALNLAEMTAATLIGLWMLIEVGGRLWRSRGRDGPLVAIQRVIILLFSAAITLRCGAEAVSLWGWDPSDPIGTGWYIAAKRFVDPVAVLCGLAALALFVLSEGTTTAQLRRKPFPARLLARLPMLRRPLWIAALSFVAAIGVVSTR